MGTSGLASRYQTALITGASSGLGLAFAQRLITEGLTVYGTTREPDRQGLPEEIQWLALEASSRLGLDRFVSYHGKLLSSIDILINNAGSSYFSRESSKISELAGGQQKLLLEAPIRLTQAALESMRERGNGAIVNVSSLAALFPLPYMATYSAGKAGLSGYTQSLLLTEKGTGVILIDFQAGDYKTPFNANIRKTEDLDNPMEQAWRRLEHNMNSAPDAERAADDLVRALDKGKSRVLRSGGFFQKVIAPLGLRLLPLSLLHSAIRKYYRIG